VCIDVWYEVAFGVKFSLVCCCLWFVGSFCFALVDMYSALIDSLFFVIGLDKDASDDDGFALFKLGVGGSEDLADVENFGKIIVLSYLSLSI
jgi:hypothetical protein